MMNQLTVEGRQGWIAVIDICLHLDNIDASYKSLSNLAISVNTHAQFEK